MIKTYTEEIWRPVVGFEERYEVSCRGRVRSLDRVMTNKSRWGQLTTFSRKGGIMSSGPHPGGYRLIRLGKTQQSFTVHRLVMEAFVGPRPEGNQIRHLDGNPHNNSLENLAYGTPVDNANDSKKHGTFQKRIRQNCKIAPEQRRTVIEMYGSGEYTMSKLGQIFGVTLGAIWWVVRRSHANLC